jgi:hypothetical protein
MLIIPTQEVLQGSNYRVDLALRAAQSAAMTEAHRTVETKVQLI